MAKTKVKPTVVEANGDDLNVRSLSKLEVQDAATFNREQAMALVGMYYNIQKLRIGAHNKMSAQERNVDIIADPVIIASLRNELKKVEKQAARGLATYAKAQPLGRWAMSNVGVGPVLTSAFLAHIDLNRAKTAGAVLRFAGLDPSLVWLGNKKAGEIVHAAFKVEKTEPGAMLWLSQAVNFRVSELYYRSGCETVNQEQALSVMKGMVGPSLHRKLTETFERYPLYADNAIHHACLDFSIEEVDVFTRLYGGCKIDKQKLVNSLTRRPYNATLKTIAWRLGESFKKVSGRDDAFYGRIYHERKAMEIQRNESGDLKEQAHERLTKAKDNRYRISPEQRAIWESGKLQPKGLDLRAMRYAVKMFISHYFEVGRSIMGLERVLPWVLVHGGHKDYIPPPNWPMKQGAERISVEEE